MSHQSYSTNTVSPELIEEVKQNTDLVSYIQSRGVELKQVGQNFKGFCPFHEEKEPSFTVNPRDNLWQCFGCGSGGDVFTFVERFDKVGFFKAFYAVKNNVSPDNSKRKPIASSLTAQWVKSRKAEDVANGKTTVNKRYQDNTVKKIKMLNMVMGFYQKEFFRDKRGLNYLRERGITDKQSMIDFGTGFVAGNLPEIMPRDEETISFLKEIGILNKNGHEMFYGCVVFPLIDFEGNVLSIYGRRVDVDQVSHLYLPGHRNGLVNWQAAKRGKTLIFTESVIDSLTLHSAGFKNSVPLYGVNSFSEHHERLLKNYTPEVIYLCFDNDEAGKECVLRTKHHIKEIQKTQKNVRRIKAYPVELPVKDINDYFKKYRAKDFESLLKQANPASAEDVEDRNKPSERFFERTKYGFITGIGKREYEVKGIAKQGTQLKATIKASLDIRNSDKFQITTIDFYSLRSREWFAKIVAELTGEHVQVVLDDLNRLLIRIEELSHKKTEEQEVVEKVELTPAEKKEALSFLMNTKLTDEILADLERMGFTGEETNKLLGYLVAISRKMEEPLSLLVQSRSAAGKSTLQDAILELVPDEDKVKYTRLTDQALFYKGENSLVHKVLAIEEAEGMGGSAYSIRALQSARELTVATTTKDPATGKLKTEEYKVNGPLSFMLTTTAVELDHEMETRFLSVSVDETREMTEKIHDKQRESETLQGYLSKKKTEHAFRKHHNAQRLLKPLAVVNPYALYLNFPSDNLRSRRDHKKYLGLIKAVAFLYQYQRTVKKIKQDNEELEYIEVTLDDIKIANKLASEVLGRSLDELSAPSRTLLGLIQKMVREAVSEKTTNDPRTNTHNFIFNRRMIREYSRWSDWQVKTHIQELEEMGYVYPHIGSKGKEYIYELKLTEELDESQKVYLDLTDVSHLEKMGINLEGKKPYLVA